MLPRQRGSEDSRPWLHVDLEIGPESAPPAKALPHVPAREKAWPLDSAVLLKDPSRDMNRLGCARPRGRLYGGFLPETVCAGSGGGKHLR